MSQRFPSCIKLLLFSVPLPTPPAPGHGSRHVSIPFVPAWEERRNDLVLNFNNTFSRVLQSTSNQGLNWICNVCSVTRKSLTHQTDSLRAGKQMSVCEPLPLSAWDCVCITTSTRLRYLNFDFFVMGFDMFHFLGGKRSRPPKVNVAKKSSRQNIKMPSSKNSANAMGLGLQVRRAGGQGGLVLGETLFVPLGCLLPLLNKLLNDFNPSSLLLPPTPPSLSVHLLLGVGRPWHSL